MTDLLPDLHARFDLAHARELAHAAAHGARRALGPLGAGDLAAIGAAALLQRLSARLGLWAYALVALPGTLAHELSHFSTAFVLRAQPSWPSLRPKAQAGGWQLGAVTFRAGWLRTLPIALAPLALLPLMLWLARTVLGGEPLSPAYLAWTWVCGAMLHGAVPSRPDWMLARPGLLAVAGLTMVAAAAAWWYGHAG